MCKGSVLNQTVKVMWVPDEKEGVVLAEVVGNQDDEVCSYKIWATRVIDNKTKLFQNFRADVPEPLFDMTLVEKQSPLKTEKLYKAFKAYKSAKVFRTNDSLCLQQ